MRERSRAHLFSLACIHLLSCLSVESSVTHQPCIHASFYFGCHSVRLDFQPLFWENEPAVTSRGGKTEHERTAEIEPIIQYHCMYCDIRSVGEASFLVLRLRKLKFRMYLGFSSRYIHLNGKEKRLKQNWKRKTHPNSFWCDIRLELRGLENNELIFLFNLKYRANIDFELFFPFISISSSSLPCGSVRHSIMSASRLLLTLIYKRSGSTLVLSWFIRFFLPFPACRCPDDS